MPSKSDEVRILAAEARAKGAVTIAENLERAAEMLLQAEQKGEAVASPVGKMAS